MELDASTADGRLERKRKARELFDRWFTPEHKRQTVLAYLSLCEGEVVSMAQEAAVDEAVGALTARVRELELIVELLANHSAHMMYNQVNNWKPRPDMDKKATDLEVRAQMAAIRGNVDA